MFSLCDFPLMEHIITRSYGWIIDKKQKEDKHNASKETA